MDIVLAIIKQKNVYSTAEMCELREKQVKWKKQSLA